MESASNTASPYQLFIELQELRARVKNGLEFTDSVFTEPVSAHSRVLWIETARWVKFEENYDEIEQRFTEAHMSPMRFSLVTLFRDHLRQYLTILDTNASTLGHALEKVALHARAKEYIKPGAQYDVLRAVLFAERWHPDVKGHMSDSAEFTEYWQITTNTEADNAHIQQGYVPDEKNADDDEITTKARSMSDALHSMISLHHQTHHPYHRFNHALTDCLESGAQACTILCGTVSFLSQPLLIVLRLNTGIRLSCISEVDVPVRFIVVYMGPELPDVKYLELARVFAVLMSNSSFQLAIANAADAKDVLEATDAFMHDSLIMPIVPYTNPEALAAMSRQISAFKHEMGYHDSEKRSKEAFSRRFSHTEISLKSTMSRKVSAFDLAIHAATDAGPECRSGGRPFVGGEKMSTRCEKFKKDFFPPFIDLARNIIPWMKRMPSDYRDAFKKENISIVLGSILFLYFVNLAPSITFAALLNTQVDPNYTVSLTLLSGGFYLIIFTLLSGQPLGFIGVSAPIFIIESSIKSVAVGAGVDAKLLRFWVAIYTALLGFLFLGFNASVMANHIRRSVEEVFNSFIAFFFILKAIFTMFKLIPSYPANPTSDDLIKFSQDMAIAGATLFLAFMKLQFCLFMAGIGRGTYFRRWIRKLLTALNVPLGIVFITAMDLIFFQNFNLPKVDIPPSNQVNTSRWLNAPPLEQLTSYGSVSAGMVHGVAIAISIAVAIIIFTESALNGITAMKNKAQKPNAFVMDMCLMHIFFPIMSGFTGWPFVSGATVRTMSNLVALVKMDRPPAPGMPQRVTGTVEQRVSGVIVGVLILLSVFLGSILRFIPLAALYGMFLYMGVMGLRNLQFFLRCLSLLKRRKHWEDWECVRGLPSGHILVFASIQAVVIAILVSLNIIAEFTVLGYAAIAFPVIILAYSLIREFLLPKWTWLAVYLHQLDRKYKLNPSPLKHVVSMGNSIVHYYQRNSIPRLSSGGLTVGPHEVETQSEDEYSEHEDGIVRHTWAT